MAITDSSAWARALLRRLGIPANSGNTRALAGWAAAEGGHWKNQATFNPLNTTQPEPGAGNTGSQGNIKAYRDWNQGLNATVQTLRNGRYAPILSALQGSDPAAVAKAIGRTPWGTNAALVAKTIGSTPAAASGSAPASVRTTTPATTSLGSPAARGALISQFLNEKNANPIDLALGLRALKTSTPARSTSSPAAGGISATGDTAELTRRANAINAKKLPYAWGGGHAGKVDPYKAQPLDCSGAVSAVLGINPRVSGELTSWGKPGDGGNKGVTVYANGHHTFMKIDGHFFGTSASNPGGGAGWIPQGQISPQYLAGFTARHS